jgi:D-glucosaminate-6-phosphate ammonia-lyase
MSIYSSLGVRRVVNACGIYTDLGGSIVGGAAWEALCEANSTWASMDELLSLSGARIAQLCGCEAARVVPGASAGLALSVGACVARGKGALMEALPLVPSVVWMQRAHEYKYARCVALAGARVEYVDDIEAVLRSPADGRPVAVVHPAHLDAAGVPLGAVAPLARAAGVPVLVDAAFMSFPVSELALWTGLGDAACFSAKYFFGPNAGGFVAGRADLVADIAALDFTGFESGAWLTFGRAWKLDRGTVAATVAALEEWTVVDHAARVRGYAELAGSLAVRLRELPGARVSEMVFTVDERLIDGPSANAVVVHGAGALVEPLAAGDPSVRALVEGDALVLCLETVRPDELELIVAAVCAHWPN